MIMGERGYRLDGSGGEIAIYLSKRIREHPDGPVILLGPSKFSYWLLNTWNRYQNWRRKR
jgi:hypothetical protein